MIDDDDDMMSDQREYEEYLRALDDAQLQDEFVELRRNYNLCRGELAQRKLVMRDRPSKTIRHLMGNQRMREAVARLSAEMREEQDEE